MSRNLTVGGVLDDAYEVFRISWKRLLAWQLLAFVPIALADVLVIRAVGRVVEILLLSGKTRGVQAALLLAAGGVAGVLIIHLFAMPIIGVGLTRGVADTHRSRPWSFADLVRVTRARAGRAVLAGIVVLSLLFALVLIPAAVTGGIAFWTWNAAGLGGVERALIVLLSLLVGATLIAAAAVWVSLRYALTVSALVVEDARVPMALARSANLMRGRYWAGLRLWLLLFLVSVSFGAVASFWVTFPAFEALDASAVAAILPDLVRAQETSTVLSEAMTMVPRAFGAAAWTVFYFSAAGMKPEDVEFRS